MAKAKNHGSSIKFKFQYPNIVKKIIKHITYLSPSAKRSAEGRARVRRAYTQIATIHFLKFFCKEMAVAHSIFTLDGGFQLFCAVFDMPMTGVALKVALGYKQIGFWAFKKNNHQVGVQV